jgi:macrodomain Ter protein organizer (MatP/YcbG family)
MKYFIVGIVMNNMILKRKQRSAAQIRFNMEEIIKEDYKTISIKKSTWLEISKLSLDLNMTKSNLIKYLVEEYKKDGTIINIQQ